MYQEIHFSLTMSTIYNKIIIIIYIYLSIDWSICQDISTELSWISTSS